MWTQLSSAGHTWRQTLITYIGVWRQILSPPARAPSCSCSRQSWLEKPPVLSTVPKPEPALVSAVPAQGAAWIAPVWRRGGVSSHRPLSLHVHTGLRRVLSKWVSNSDAEKLVPGVRSGRGGIFKDRGELSALDLLTQDLKSGAPTAYVFEVMSATFVKVWLLAYMLRACWAANLCTSENFIPESSACSIATCDNNPLIKCHPS